MAIHDLKEQIGRLPEQPGVYLFSNREGETIYVGKASVLRDRVRSYLGAAGTNPRIDALLRDAAALDVIVTDSVVEALALENGLIKQRNPRFNVLLRDDKTYPYLQLTLTERAPRLLVARQVQRDGNAYAGPFMPAALARRTMALAQRLFGIRSCNEVIDGKRDRPCLEYDIKRCIAPCVDSICSIARYDEAVEQARLLMDGKQEELIDGLKVQMSNAATDEQFEHAAQLRDAIGTIETLRDRQQKIATPRLGDRDAFGVKSGTSGSIVAIFQVRSGRVVDKQELRGSDPFSTGFAQMGTDVELLTAAVQQFYADRVPPPEVHLPVEIDTTDREALQLWLTDRAGRKVTIEVPKRGDRRGLIELAMRNAAMGYQQYFGDGAGASFEALDTLRAVLNLPGLPRRIDCFDISTLQGSQTVASMVVCVDGRMRKGEYRKFKIRPGFQSSKVSGFQSSGVSGLHSSSVTGLQGALGERFLDDFAAMEQVVLRRYQKVMEEGGPFPDLIVIDGGKGQLAAAYKALRQIGLERLMAIGLAKQEELIFTREREDGIALPHHTAALQLLQRIRDEAHRFAITFHRASRTKATLRSELDEIPGIGPKRRNQLLRAFGSVTGVRRASREDLTRVVGAKAAETVIKYFS